MPSENQEKASQEEREGFDVKDFLAHFLSGLVKTVQLNVIDNIRKQAHLIGLRVRMAILGSTILLVGFVCIVIGLALLLEQAIGVRGGGFLIMGAVVMLFGFAVKYGVAR